MSILLRDPLRNILINSDYKTIKKFILTNKNVIDITSDYYFWYMKVSNDIRNIRNDDINSYLYKACADNAKEIFDIIKDLNIINFYEDDIFYGMVESSSVDMIIYCNFLSI